jgi:hypothetical protein
VLTSVLFGMGAFVIFWNPKKWIGVMSRKTPLRPVCTGF